MNINDTLDEREATHGSFEDNAEFVQFQKSYLRAYEGWNRLSLVQREALDMIVSKIGRILNGNPNEVDHFRDIVGYASLVIKSIKVD